jgi:type IV pilus assembly protein PilB
MGRISIDDILRQLGEPHPAAPVERVPQPPAKVGPAAGAAEDAKSAAAPHASIDGAPKAGASIPESPRDFSWPAPDDAAPAAGTASHPEPRASVETDIASPDAPVPDDSLLDASATPASAATEAIAPDAGFESATPADSLHASPAQSVPPANATGTGGAHFGADRTDGPRGEYGGDLDDLYIPDAEEAPAALDLESVLAERGLANAEQILAARRLLKQSPGRRVTDILREQGCDENAMQAVVAELSRMPFERIDARTGFDRALCVRLGADFCRSNLALPLRTEGTRVVVATASPEDVFLVDDVKRRLGAPAARHVLASASDILAALQHADEAHAAAEEDGVDFDALLSGVEEEEVEVEKDDVVERDLEAEAESSPVVRYVNSIIANALKEGASDIHIEPDERTCKVRFRIDGVLFEMMTPPKKYHAALTSRIKIMANLDIAERRLPQDGRIRAHVAGRRLDLRVSTVPTPKGEKTVMRILDSRSISVSLDDLGFSEDALTIWKKQIEQPHGIILVTGPTGSGKTTTLYASIRQMDTRRMNVSTVEDPIEYNLAGITQIQTHEKIGMTFAAALKALLRQDPDVVMLGEIRDQETAHTAIQAALTGHLVLSTLHTNDAPSSVTRMINIGIEPFLVGAALNGVLAQRLVRRICPKCVEDRPIPEDMREFVAMHGIEGETLRAGRGCPACRQTGYSGRVGLYELLVLDDFLRDRIAGNPNVVEFRRLCIERGMTSLREDGFLKVRAGRTTVEEVLSVTEATI